MAGAKIALSATTGELQADTYNKAAVNTPLTEGQAGFIRITSAIDDGDVTGTVYTLPPETSGDFRLRVGTDTLMFSEKFVGSAINSAKFTTPATTATATVASGYLSLNAVSTATGNVARCSSYRAFPCFTSYGIYFETAITFTQDRPTNNVCEWGLGIATGTSTPTDGAFFRFNEAGEFRGVVSFGGSESQTSAIDWTTLVGANVAAHYIVQLTETRVNFWVDNVLVGAIEIGNVSGGNLTATSNLPIFFRNRNNGTAGAIQNMQIAWVTTSMIDAASGKPWSHCMAGAGHMGYQEQTTNTMGSTANYANSANPTAAVPTNTTAALGSGLGGQFWETDTLAVTTDGVISSYQVPALSSSKPGKCLYVTGVSISSFIQTALTGGGYVAQWSLAFGHTSVSLATAEAPASSTKAARRVPLGLQTVASAATALTLLNTVEQRFDSPICVQPGEFIATVKKKIGTAPSAGVVGHVVTFDCYFE